MPTADALAREARERALREGNAGHPAAGVLGDAVAQLTGKPDESANLATALLNRSFACLTLVRVNQARADLVWCLRIAGGAGLDLIAAKARHNLGYCDLLAGDIPAAL